jgi:hypothetical protein
LILVPGEYRTPVLKNERRIALFWSAGNAPTLAKNRRHALPWNKYCSTFDV